MQKEIYRKRERGGRFVCMCVLVKPVLFLSCAVRCCSCLVFVYVAFRIFISLYTIYL